MSRLWIIVVFLAAPAYAADPASQPASIPAVEKLSLADVLRLTGERFALVTDAEWQVRVQQAQKDQAFWAFWTPIEVIGMIGGPTPEARGNGTYLRTEASLQGDLNFGKPGFFAGYRAQGAIPVMTFGKLHSLRALGKIGVTIAEANKERVKNEAKANAARAYFGHIAAQGFLDLVGESEKTLQDALKNAERMVQANSDQVSDNDIFMLRTLLSQLVARRAEAQAGAASAKEAIRFLTRGDEDAPLELEAVNLRLPDAPPVAVDVLQSAAHEHRAELSMADKAVSARKEALWIKKASLFPDFFLFGYYTQNYTSNQDYQRNPFLNNVANEWSGGIAIGARLTLDIPMKVAQIKEAEAELHKAENQLSAADGYISLQVKKAYADLQSARAQALELQRAERSAKSWVISSVLNFNSGLSPAGDLFQAIRAYAESSAMRRKAELDYHTAVTAVAEAVGVDYLGAFELVHASRGR
ncbi:MAG: TolC family protein [Deltaproteobacteria bacterium]|nr:TolC family protein [Deltaproteobacteria bacterium]